MPIVEDVRTEARLAVGSLSDPATRALLTAAGLCFFAIGAGFLLATMLAASMAPGYDMGAAAISDLGTLSETARLFNGTLLATGLLNALGGVLLFRAWSGPALLALHLLGAVGAVGAGLVTLETPEIHGLFALLAFLAFNLQAIAGGLRLGVAMRWIGVGLGLVGLAYTVAMALGDGGDASWFGAIGHGGTERMIVHPPMLWLVALGSHLLALGERR